RRAVERHEVGPRLLEAEANALGIDDLDRGHPGLERGGAATLVALERELHVVGGQRLAVVEPQALAQHELVAEPVLRDRPRLRRDAPNAGGVWGAMSGPPIQKGETYTWRLHECCTPAPRSSPLPWCCSPGRRARRPSPPRRRRCRSMPTTSAAWSPASTDRK